MFTVDLYDARFWVFLGIVILVLVPIRVLRFRQLVLAFFNLSFVFLHLTPAKFAVALGILVAAWVVLRFLGSGRSRAAVAILGVASLAILFAIHKIPHPLPIPGIQGFKGILSVVGFSYIVLRLYELGDAVRLGRHPAPDFASMINYVIPFNMLAAGPIQAYDDFLVHRVVPAPLDFNRALVAVERITTGLFKKFILANFLEKMFLTGFHARGPYFFVEAQLNYLWLFLDFSAYSDVAIGIGALIGVATPENFNRPYLARNVIDFWERWHISLSQFIRRNVFIPIQLALVRKWDGQSPLLAACVAFTLSFMLCGIWHNLNLPWFLWGLYQAFGLIVCSLYKQFLIDRVGRKGLKKYMANPWFHALAVVLTFEFTACGVLLVTYPFEELLSWSTNRPPTP